jgi:hypothetical protein
MWYWQNPISEKRAAFLLPQIMDWAYNKWIYHQPDQIERRSEDILNWLAEADPTNSGQYIGWLFKILKNKKMRLPEDIQTLNELLQEFHLKKHKLPEKYRNIYVFETPGKISKILREYIVESKREKLRRLITEGQEKIYNDVDPEGVFDYQIIKITTPEAAAQLLRNTRWCVKDPKWANIYLKKAPLYLIIDRGEYLALAHASDDVVEVRDPDDDPITEEHPYITIIKNLLFGLNSKFICKFHNRIKNTECSGCGTENQCFSCMSTCSECDSKYCNNCLVRCDVCREICCKDCSEKCADCEKDICDNDATKCDCCHEDVFCTECIRKCKLCEHDFGGDCVEACDICSDEICNCCRSECPQCFSVAGICCMKTCKECMRYFCDSCLSRDRICAECREFEEAEDY